MVNKTNILQIDREDIFALFPPLHKRINKGDAGRVLCVCGSYDPTGSAMCGAAYFSASAAYKCGAGIVEIFTHRKNYEALASLIPEAVFSLYDTEAENAEDICSRLTKQTEKADSVILGCGLGKSALSQQLVKTTLLNVNCPLIIDADGLNIISDDKSLISLMSNEQRARTVITPHPGEMSRLCGITISEILSDTVGVARSFADQNGVICLLKDNKTVITDGNTVFVNHSGNPGMASAGMGDVLAGMIGAIIARNTISDLVRSERLDICQALYRAATAAYVHGLAGDIARDELGEYSLTASDVVRSISKAIKSNK